MREYYENSCDFPIILARVLPHQRGSGVAARWRLQSVRIDRPAQLSRWRGLCWLPRWSHRSAVAPNGVYDVSRAVGAARRLAANYLSFLCIACVLEPWLLCGQRFDVIFVYVISPIFQKISGIVLKTFKRAALVTWVQDLWQQRLQATGFVRNRSIVADVTQSDVWKSAAGEHRCNI